MSQAQDSRPDAEDLGGDAARVADAANADDAAGSVQAAGPSVGQRLRTAREARGWAVEDVAARLKLSLGQVVALESDDLSHMHCNAITRGFIRNYARLLGLDAAELMGALGQDMTARQNTATVPGSIEAPVISSSRFAFHRNYFWVVVSLLLCAVAVAYLFLPTDFVQTTLAPFSERFGSAPASSNASPDDVAGRAAMPQPAQSQQSPEAASPAASGVITAPVIIAPGAASPEAAALSAIHSGSSAVTPAGAASAPQAASALDSPASADGNTLKFAFAQSSWVEVKDGKGKVIFSQLNPPNSQREVSGQPPFSLLIGNASSVSVSYRGKPVDLSKRSKDDVARVTVE